LQKTEILGILDLETGNICRPFPVAVLLLFQGVPFGNPPYPMNSNPAAELLTFRRIHIIMKRY
jgi:hypothetical protein